MHLLSIRTLTSWKVLINNKFKAQTLTWNPSGYLCCHVLASRALNMSCSFGQSARSIESRCLVTHRIPCMTTSSNGNIFPRYWPLVRRIHRSPVDFPYNGQWREALMFSLSCAWTNSWANYRDISYMGRHRAHYDATAMWLQFFIQLLSVNQMKLLMCIQNFRVYILSFRYGLRNISSQN